MIKQISIKLALLLSLLMSICTVSLILPAGALAATAQQTGNAGVYDEPGLYEGTADLTVSAGTGNTEPATITKVSGVFGKAEDDISYRLDVNSGHSGKNFIGLAPRVLDTACWEISYAVTGDSPDMTLSGCYFISNAAVDKVGDKTNYMSSPVLNIKNDGIYVGVTSGIDESVRGIRLCETEAGQWINLAVVIPGYNAEIRPFLFDALKTNYINAAKEIGNPGRSVPVGEAVNYAVGTLGFPEYIKDEAGENKPYSRGMYRDSTCHLSIPYGRILAALCWYEYITGHDARENPYQSNMITPADMKLLKEAAHFACSQSEYRKSDR